MNNESNRYLRFDEGEFNEDSTKLSLVRQNLPYSVVIRNWSHADFAPPSYSFFTTRLYLEEVDMRGCGFFRSLNVDLSDPHESWFICRIRQAEPWFTLMSQAEILRELGLERTVMERNLKGLKEDMRYGQNSGILLM